MNSLDKVCLEFEALRERLKQAKEPDERLRIIRKMAAALRKMDAILALKDSS